MVPGSAHWNMSAQAFKFSFSFSPQEASSLFNDSLSAQMQTSRESTGSPSQPAAIMQQLLFSIRNRRSFEPQKSMPSVDGYGILPGDEDLPTLSARIVDSYLVEDDLAADAGKTGLRGAQLGEWYNKLCEVLLITERGILFE